MIGIPIDCVVDASVGIKLVVTETDSAQAALLFDHLTRDPNAAFRVPDLFFAECTNVLRTRAKRGDFSTSEAMAKLGSLRALYFTRSEVMVFWRAGWRKPPEETTSDLSFSPVAYAPGSPGIVSF